MCALLYIAVVNYLDDFAGADRPELALKSYTELGNLLVSCGLEEAKEKACPPCTKMVFIGVYFNTEDLTLSVTPNRVRETLNLIDLWLKKDSAMLQELQSLIGKLSFIVSCVHSSRVFICRLLNWLREIHSCVTAQPIPNLIHKDLKWWKTFLPQYNGVSMMLLEDWSEPDGIFACDACPTGCGGIMQSSYFHEQFPDFIMEKHLHINALELLTVVVALKVWGHKLKGKKVLIYCDNLSSVNLINRGFSRDDFHQSCLRELCYIAAVNEFIVRAQHIKGVENRQPDILSRWHLNSRSSELFKESLNGKTAHRVRVESPLFRFVNPW